MRFPLTSTLRRTRAGTQLRTIVTPVVEPPPNVVERPCNLILSEDQDFYPTSWRSAFQETFPAQHGVGYASHQFSDMVDSFDACLTELQVDLSPLAPPPVLVARGPWISWVAQFYLESLPLAGLILVDPMALDDRNGINQFELYHKKLGLHHTKTFAMFQEFQEHWGGHWMLQLEPGSVPMSVYYTVDRPAFKRCAENTALRHSLEGPFGRVGVEKIDTKSGPDDHAQEAAAYIYNWIDNHVL